MVHSVVAVFFFAPVVGIFAETSKTKAMKAQDIIKRVAQETDKCLLFHSATGKDSICLLDLVAPHFKEVVCVFMYEVPNLQCVNRYIRFAEALYSNVRFIQCPHFNTSTWIKSGYLGCAQNPKQKILSMMDITEIARQKTGIEWAFFGFKEADSLNRRVFLRRTAQENGGYCINFKTKKAYPLNLYKHGDIVKYISENGLMTPQNSGCCTSSGESVEDARFLTFLRDNFPQDLQQVYRYYPGAERILFEYDEAVRQYNEQQLQTE